MTATPLHKARLKPDMSVSRVSPPPSPPPPPPPPPPSQQPLRVQLPSSLLLITAAAAATLAAHAPCAAASHAYLREGRATSSVVVGGRVYFTLDGDTAVYSADDGGSSKRVFDAAELGGACRATPTRSSPSAAAAARGASLSGIAGGLVGEAWCSGTTAGAEGNYLQLDFDTATRVRRLDLAGRCTLPNNAGCTEYATAVRIRYWNGYEWAAHAAVLQGAPAGGNGVLSVALTGLPTAVRSLRLYPTEHVGAACLRVEAFGHCSLMQAQAAAAAAGGSGAGKPSSPPPALARVELNAYPGGDSAAVFVSSAAAAPDAGRAAEWAERNEPGRHFLYVVNLRGYAAARAAGDWDGAEAFVSLVYECGGRHHAYCTKRGGVPYMYAVQSGDVGGAADSGIAMLRPSGTGRVYKMAAGVPVLVHDSAEWRGLGAAVREENGTEPLSWVDGSSGGGFLTNAEANALRYSEVASRLEGEAVVKLACEDALARRQLYTTFQKENDFLTAAPFNGPYLSSIYSAASALPQHARNDTWEYTSHGLCSLSSDFSSSLVGDECVSVDATTGFVSNWGGRLGMHLPGACSAPAGSGVGGSGGGSVRLMFDASGEVVDRGAVDFYVLLQGKIYFRGYDAAHGMELRSLDVGSETAADPGAYRRGYLSALKNSAASALPQRCMETYLDGQTMYTGFLSSLLAGRDSFHLEMHVYPTDNGTADAYVLSHVEARAGAGHHLEEWQVTLRQGSVGMSFPNLAGCTVDVPVPLSAETTLSVAVDPAIGGCASVPVGTNTTGRFLADVVSPGVLNVTRVDGASAGWAFEFTLKCWVSGCAGGAFDMAARRRTPGNEGGYTKVEVQCDADTCSLLRDNNVVASTLNVTTVLAHTSSVVQYGATLSFPARKATQGFVGYIKDVRIDGTCVLPDLTESPDDSDSEQCSSDSSAQYSSSLALDILPGEGSSNPICGQALRGRLLFLAATDSQTYHLHAYHPASRRLSALAPGIPVLLHASVAPASPVPLLLPNLGLALWLVRGGVLVSDGSAHGTHLHPLGAGVDAARSGDARTPGAAQAAHVVRDDANGAEIVFFCGGGGGGENDGAEAALCVAAFAPSPAEPPHLSRRPLSRGALFRASPGRFLLSSSGAGGDVVTRFFEAPANRPLPGGGGVGALARRTCVLPTQAALLDAARPSENFADGFLAVSANEGGVLGAGKATLLAFRTAAFLATAESVALRLSVLSANFADGAAAQTRGLGGWCDELLVEVLDAASVAWDDDTVTHASYAALLAASSSQQPRVLATRNVSVADLVGSGTGTLRIDVTDAVRAAAAAGAAPDALVLRLSLPADACASRPEPYTLVLAPPGDATPRHRPALCVGENRAQVVRGALGSYLRLPDAALWRVDAHAGAGAAKGALGEDTWFYAGCGEAAVRFKLDAEAVAVLVHGAHGDGRRLRAHKEYRSTLREAQVVRGGAVDALPDALVVRQDGGIVLVSSRRADAAFVSTQPDQDARSCNYAYPAAADTAYLGFLDNGAGEHVASVQMCGESCEASGGRCAGFECRCPENRVSVDGHACECGAGYYGHSCSVRCVASETCGGRGVCTEHGNCRCDLGYGGAACAETLSCAALQALYPTAKVACERVSPSLAVIGEGQVPVTPAIDSCKACLSEGYEVVGGVRRYYCLQK